MLETIALSLPSPAAFPGLRDRAAVMEDLRRLLLPPREPRKNCTAILPFGLAALDSHLPEGGLPGAALHEVVPETAGASAAAFGFIVGILARLPQTRPLIFVMPAYGQRQHGRLSGHGLNSLGLD